MKIPHAKGTSKPNPIKLPDPVGEGTTMIKGGP